MDRDANAAVNIMNEEKNLLQNVHDSTRQHNKVRNQTNKKNREARG